MKTVELVAITSVFSLLFLFVSLTTVSLRAGEIHDAATVGDLNKVRALLEADSTLLESKDSDGNTPLISACFAPPSFFPKVEVANFLIDHGADINARNKSGASPLYFAIRDFDLVQDLIAKGADVNVRAYGNRTPLLQTTAFTGNLKVAKLLIDHGADPNARGEPGTALQMVIKNHGSSEMVTLLVENGAKFQKSGYDNTELHLAVLNGYTDLARTLIKLGADVEAVNTYNHTPLAYATSHGYRAMADMLIAAGAKESAIVETNYDKAPQLAETLKPGEAYLWYLGGTAPITGYAVKTKDHLLIFDPSGIDSSPEAGLRNGHLNPNELAGLKITVLITRTPHPRFGPSFSALAKCMPGANFVLGYKPTTTGNAGNSDLPPYRLAAPNESFSVDDIRVHTIPSIHVPAMNRVFPGGEGLGYLVEADGMKIFHAGIHASGNGASQLKEYRQQIDFLKPFGPIDLVILPIKGRHLTISYEPYLYLLDQLSPKAIYLIGDDLDTEEHQKCVEVLRARNVPVSYPEGGIAVGERFHYLRDQAPEAQSLKTKAAIGDFEKFRALLDTYPTLLSRGRTSEGRAVSLPPGASIAATASTAKSSQKSTK